ncbi:late competence development ComFB family protein [Alkaliphilus serpentinus]|uniref:Late competence development ComFB family protein n=2 Tax=Alkaliphilus serpentinus TaxID=1482731 RepID=A0A833M900_9FIRM|nr:late competence development ComFB family protein [Alkaliphilus serpentinus]
MRVKNYMEDVIDRMFPEVIKRYPEVCKCQRCASDIKAIALNHLPPKYVATEAGEVYTKVNELSSQFEADAITALVIAIKKVIERPRH